MANEPIITLVGNLTDDPELRFLPSGVPVANFKVASTPRNKVNDEWVDGETLFVSCAAWRALGENVAESLQRGMQVIVQGRFKVRNYEHNGEKRTSMELDVDAVGPSLARATARVTKVNHSGGQGGGGQQQPQQAAPANDPWATPAAPATDPWAQG